jgi:adenylate kinase
MNIILFGPPGAGKGTQSQQLKEKYGLTYLSTGDILREEMAAESEIGKKVKDIISKGGLVSDEIVVSIIKGRVGANLKSAGFLFDGFPRTVRQAEMLDEIMKEFSLKINAVYSLEVPEEILINRMLERGKTSGRADDNIDSIKHRFVEYREKTAPVLDYYKKQGNLVGINGVGEISDIFNNLCKEIESLDLRL